jgi:hypothetical protein
MIRTHILMVRVLRRCLGPLLAATLLILAGCSTTSLGSTSAGATDHWLLAHDLDRAVVTLRHQPASVRLAGEISTGGTVCQPAALPLSQIHLRQGAEYRTIPLGTVQQIKVVRHGRGALDGALIGLVAGGLSGVLLGYSAGDSRNLDDCGYPCKAGDKAQFAGLIFAGIGTAVGALVGAAVGHRDLLVF